MHGFKETEDYLPKKRRLRITGKRIKKQWLQKEREKGCSSEHMKLRVEFIMRAIWLPGTVKS